MVCYVAWNSKTARLIGVYAELRRAKSRVSQLTSGTWVEETEPANPSRGDEFPGDVVLAVKGDYRIRRVRLT